MTLEQLVAAAHARAASDLHLEPGLPPTARVRGSLEALGEPLPGSALSAMVRGLLGDERWHEFRNQRSFDLARTISGVRCRINALHSMRGVGLALRIMPTTLPTLDSLNLHPDLRQLVRAPHGLVLVSGSTGSGKSSTLAALLQEINLTQSRHVLTIEQPIEYALRPRQAFIRQREVGRDTPSFDQALLDALREDPDVIMVGEMRHPETMRLTLNAAETGHLVLATLHSSSAAEALQRIVLAFPPEIQPSIAAQLADCLVGVVCQRLTWRRDLKLRVPECEILRASSAARAVIRQSEFYKLSSVLETGGSAGMYSWERYRRWLAGRTSWSRPAQERPAATSEPEEFVPAHASEPLTRRPPRSQAEPERGPRQRHRSPPASPQSDAEPGVLVIDAPSGDLGSILEELDQRGR